MQLIGSVARATLVTGGERIAERERTRAQAAHIAREAQVARNARNGRSSVMNRVEQATAGLKGRGVAESIALIERQRPLDRDIWLIAEMEGAARPSVLRRFGNPRKEVQARYLAEAGLETRDQTA
jgi:hypothetical protein